MQIVKKLLHAALMTMTGVVGGRQARADMRRTMTLGFHKRVILSDLQAFFFVFVCNS